MNPRGISSRRYNQVFEHVSAIPFGTGRPNRETAINADDITNLNIAFNTAKSFEDFLAQI